MFWNIEETDQAVVAPRSEGKSIPPEIVKALEESLETGSTKRVPISTPDELKELERIFRSLRRRTDGVCGKNVDHDEQDRAVAVRFQAIEHKQPETDIAKRKTAKKQ